MFIALAEYETMLPSCVAIGDTSDPVTEDVVCVGTLQELVDKVRADKSKKKVFIPTGCLHSSPPYTYIREFEQGWVLGEKKMLTLMLRLNCI
ncbi:hypothetical protein Hanom_Chr11g01007491 [Helianthus anomalus]